MKKRNPIAKVITHIRPQRREGKRKPPPEIDLIDDSEEQNQKEKEDYEDV